MPEVGLFLNNLQSEENLLIIWTKCEGWIAFNENSQNNQLSLTKKSIFIEDKRTLSPIHIHKGFINVALAFNENNQLSFKLIFWR